MIARARAVLEDTAPARLDMRGRYTAFRVLHADGSSGCCLRGLTKCLAENVFSAAKLPWSSWSSADTQAWCRGSCASSDAPRARGVGRKRGRLVDQKITCLVNSDTGGTKRGPVRGASRKASRKASQPAGSLAHFAIDAMASMGLRPVVAQRAVADVSRRLGTAVDLIAVNESNELVVVEVKCGYSTKRHQAALLRGVPQRLQAPLSRVDDCAYARHMSQLAATLAMFTAERATMVRLAECGVSVRACGSDVRGALVYVAADAVERTDMPKWWRSRAHQVLAVCAA